MELELADALAFDPGPVSLVITNPPLGRRVRRDSGLKNTLVEFFVRAGRMLAPGGRLVWVCPHPELVRARANDAGLALERSYTVDMGGFDCALERWNKPAGPALARRG
jgi:16S rRNA G1207 methylase RsmC